MKKIYLGIDVGSVSCNLVAVDEKKEVVATVNIRTHGQPIKVIQQGLLELERKLSEKGDFEVAGVGTTGSARTLAGMIVGADVVKNEITAHATGAKQIVPGVRTILEIGGQDSKIIILREGVVVDFAMNTICAAGTGSFLDQQCSRLGMEIEDFGEEALTSEKPVAIAGRCTVFAESDMIHKTQVGAERKDILRGLSDALVRNYLNNVAKGKDLAEPIVFQGGVAFNEAIKKAFEEEIGKKIIIPKYHDVMGALGMAILASETNDSKARGENIKTKFCGFKVGKQKFLTTSFVCEDCSNNCEVIELKKDGKLVARWGGRCGKWDK